MPAACNVDLYSGGLLETHTLASYRSLGESRAVSLVYDSLRADPSPIVHVDYTNLTSSVYSVPDSVRLAASLSISRGTYRKDVPGYAGSVSGLQAGQHFWSLTKAQRNVDVALQASLDVEPSGIYDVTIRTGLVGPTRGNRYTGRLTDEKTRILHVNSVNSVFGSGWGIAGLYEVVENTSGPAMVVDGNGSELLFTRATQNSTIFTSPPGDFSILSKQANGTFRRQMPDGSVHIFDAQNRLASATDRNGNTTQYEYNTQGIERIVDPLGQATRFEYANGKVTKIIQPGPSETLLDYDPAGNLTLIKDPDGAVRQWDYDARHRMIGETDQRGKHEASQYSFAGRVIQATRKDGSQLKFDTVQTQGLLPADKTRAIAGAPLAPLRTPSMARIKTPMAKSRACGWMPTASASWPLTESAAALRSPAITRIWWPRLWTLVEIRPR